MGASTSAYWLTPSLGGLLVDAGDVAAPGIPKDDFMGNPRSRRPDVGAFEYTGRRVVIHEGRARPPRSPQ